nr:phosphoglycolate phosphatase [Rhodoferax sp. PAMC 29310]
MNLSNIDAVIVDLDGTMVDTLGDFRVALNAMLGDLPPPYASQQVDQATVERLVGKGSEHLIKSVLALLGNDTPKDGVAQRESLYLHAWESYQRHYARVNGQFSTVYPGVLRGLQQLQAKGLRLACLTNKPTEFALTLLRHKGLDGFFEMTFGGDAFEKKKPDPMPLIKTCEALGVRTERTLMIGDSSNDAQAARAAGCPVVLVTYGYNHGQSVREVDADGLVDALDQLTATL